jgi:hypothetical protein
MLVIRLFSIIEKVSFQAIFVFNQDYSTAPIGDGLAVAMDSNE